MVGVTLLAEARAAGLEVRAESERLIVRGPSSAEALARRLLDNKPTVFVELEAEQAWATVEAIATEGRRRWMRAEQLEQSDDPGDQFLAEHHRDEVRGAVTHPWLPAIRHWARLQHRLGRLEPEHHWLVEDDNGEQR